MVEKLKTAVHNGINELFALAAVDEMSGDAAAYKEKLQTIARIAELLRIETEITTVTVNLKEGTNKLKVELD